MRINDDEFIDGSNVDLSGYARYMNHAKAKANVAKFISQAPVCEWLCVCGMWCHGRVCVTHGRLCVTNGVIIRGVVERAAFLRCATYELGKSC